MLYTVEEQILKELQEVCKPYGYRVFLRFNQVHIRTHFEAWYFEAREDGIVKLMHGNTIGDEPKGWHKQFSRSKMSYADLAKYIHEHEEAKYTNKVIKYSYNYYGVPRAAFASS